MHLWWRSITIFFKISSANYHLLKVLVAPFCPTPCDPMEYSPPRSSVHGILQARIQEQIAIPFSRESSRTRGQTQVSCIPGRFFTDWVTREALPIVKTLENDDQAYIISVEWKTFWKLSVTRQSQMHFHLLMDPSGLTQGSTNLLSKTKDTFFKKSPKSRSSIKV